MRCVCILDILRMLMQASQSRVSPKMRLLLLSEVFISRISALICAGHESRPNLPGSLRVQKSGLGSHGWAGLGLGLGWGSGWHMPILISLRHYLGRSDCTMMRACRPVPCARLPACPPALRMPGLWHHWHQWHAGSSILPSRLQANANAVC